MKELDNNDFDAEDVDIKRVMEEMSKDPKE